MLALAMIDDIQDGVGLPVLHTILYGRQIRGQRLAHLRQVVADLLRREAIDLANLDDKARFQALVFDASEIADADGLRALYDFFHPLMRKIGKGGRVVVLGRPPEAADTPEAASAQGRDWISRFSDSRVRTNSCASQPPSRSSTAR